MASSRSMAEGLSMGDKFARTGGYVAVGTVGLGIGAVIAFMAITEGLCNSWGEQCSPEQNAEIGRLWGLAFAVPLALVGIYALVDFVASASRRRRSRPDRDGD